MKRAKSICNKAGCSELLDKPGYCEKHKKRACEHFAKLDKKKTAESIRFYGSYAWTKTSIAHRTREPLCRRCRADGKIVPADLVHHNPPLDVLRKKGLNPFDDKYLESLCNAHHLEELRSKRK